MICMYIVLVCLSISKNTWFSGVILGLHSYFIVLFRGDSQAVLICDENLSEYWFVGVLGLGGVLLFFGGLAF